MAKSEKSKIEAIYSGAPLPHRKTMVEMRKSILSIIPQAKEVISYGMGPKAAQLIMKEMRRNQITFKKKQ